MSLADERLYAAVTRGDIEGVKAALSQGASPHASSWRKESALFQAAAKYGIACLLVAAGADIDGPDCDGHTPLMHAVLLLNRGRSHEIREQSARVANLLLRAGCNVNCVVQSAPVSREGFHGGFTSFVGCIYEGGESMGGWSDGTTALMIAAYFLNVPTIEILLAHGADPSLRDDKGRDAQAQVTEGGWERASREEASREKASREVAMTAAFQLLERAKNQYATAGRINQTSARWWQFWK